jgi:hypothetical protein
MRYLEVKEEYRGQIIDLNVSGIGRFKLNTDKLSGDKSFYIKNGLGYLFEDVSKFNKRLLEEKEKQALLNEEKSDLIDIFEEEEKVAQIEEKEPIKKAGIPKKTQ